MTESQAYRRWMVSIAISVLSIVVVGATWYQVDASYSPNKDQLVSESSAISALHVKLRKQRLWRDHWYQRIPTGVYVRALSFDNANDVYLKGFIWQALPDELLASNTEQDALCRPHFRFPEEVGGHTTPEFVQKTEQDGRLICRWLFEVTVRQSFDYSKYPLDHKTVWLKIEPLDNYDKYLLVPWLRSYPSTDTDDLFGYHKRIVLGNWRINETFYDYKYTLQETNFGITGESTVENIPQLHFNIVMKRKFVNAFVVLLIPMLTVSTLLFAVLVAVSTDPQRVQLTGFSFMSVVGTVSALFFVVVLSHVSVRTQFPSQGFVYIEHFYVVLYVVMMFVVGIAYANVQWRLPLLQAHDNFWPKVVYWPVNMLILAVVTLLEFY